MKDKEIVCQNCGRKLARWTEDGAVAYWPCEVESVARECGSDHAEVIFTCPDCGCKATVKT